MTGLNGDLINKYYNTNQTLSAKFKNLLASTIIQKEYEKNQIHSIFKITTDRFLQLRKQICDIYPAENPLCYYVPYNTFSKCKASGKLWDQYNSIKKNFVNQCNHNKDN